ncbi:MAG: hypothetical protein JSW27_00960 [Phycisphaerales bacterium]|nr:MAG: hypothetical protein JSW27_00960 [Phycisphaerales bacterium]
MKSQSIPDRTEFLAEAAVAMEAALEELQHYFRFGRHRKELQQNAFRILSRCGLLLSSLLAAERETPSGIFKKNPALATLFDTLYSEVPHNHDYAAQGFHASDRGTDLTGQAKWFRLWAKVLEQSGITTASEIGQFSDGLLKCLADDEPSHTKPTEEQQTTLADLLSTAESGRLFQHSLRILENLIAALADFFAQLDPATHLHEQVRVLTCLLSRVRRTVVYQSVAKGPYTMRDDVGWQPSRLRRYVARGKTLGLLTVGTSAESGELTCTYVPEPGAGKKERSWTLAVAALPCDYEELLFKTWSYETGEYQRIVDLFGQSGARWVVDRAEGDRLETICRQVDELLDRLDAHQTCRAAREHLFRLARNNQGRWAPGELPWTFVRDLDRAIDRLRFACREAASPGGHNRIAKVLSQLWSPETPRPQVDASDLAEEADGNTGNDQTVTAVQDDIQRQTLLAPAESPESAPKDGRPKQPRSRVEKLASTMNILLGESDQGKDTDSPSGA